MKSKRQRFEDVAGNRVQYIVDKIELLSNCSNRNNYEYSDEDVKKMFSAIRNKLRIAEAKFEAELSRKRDNRFKF